MLEDLFKVVKTRFNGTEGKSDEGVRKRTFLTICF